MGGLNKDRIVALAADLANADNVGALLRAGSDGDAISSTLIGGKEALDVNLVGGADSGIFADGTAWGAGSKGQSALFVRKDAQGPLTGVDDGDWTPGQVDAQGRLRMIADIDLTGDLVGDDEPDTEDPLKIGSRVTNAALVGVSAAGDKANVISDLYRRVYVNDSPNILARSSAVSMTDVAAPLPAVALPGRRRMVVQNPSNSDELAIGGSAVTFAAGLKVPKGGSLSVEIGEHALLYGIMAATKTVTAIAFELA